MPTPSAPVISNAPLAKDQSLSFFWYSPADDGGSPITGYRFTVQPDNTTYTIATPSSNYYTISSLTNGATYTVSLEATNDGSTYGPISIFRPFEPGFPPTAPVSTCSATFLTSNLAAVTWTSPLTLPTAPLLGYYLQSVSCNVADTVYRFSALPSQTSYLFPNLNADSIYQFFVRPVNAPGYGPSLYTSTLSYFPPLVTSGLFVRLDANTYSGSGNWTNTGSLGATYNATLASGSPSKNGAGNGIVFNGSLSYEVPNIASITNIFTLSIWVKRLASFNGFSAVLTQDFAGGPINYMLGPANTGSPVIQVGHYTSGFYLTDSSTMPLNTWFNVAATFDGTSYRLYENGTLKTLYTPGASPANSGLKYWIGRLWAPSYFIGEVGQILMYNRSLSAVEVAQNYAATSNVYAI